MINGTIRRVDTLGRIVIPSSVRQGLGIDCGDTLEMYVAKNARTNGSHVVLNKHSVLQELDDLIKDYAGILAEFTQDTVCITDNDMVIAASGNLAVVATGKRLNISIAELLGGRDIFENSSYMTGFRDVFCNEHGNTYNSYIVAPIVSNSELFGAVIILSNEPTVSKVSVTHAKVAAKFLGSLVITDY